ncbi:MAG: S24 family peptidase [Anaerolineae bacterium]|nr:MAG: S24 family peptidase [Anaerolineae bacterium]
MDEAEPTVTTVDAQTTDLAAIRVQGDAMAPAYCHGDVVLYRRPDEHLTLQPGDDVLVLLADPAGSLQLLLRRLTRWDKEVMELQALNAGYLPIVEHPDHAVLCGQVIARLSPDF